MKNAEIITAINRLNERAQRESRAIERDPGYERMNIRAVYIIARNKKELEKNLVPYNEALDSLMKQYQVSLNEKGMISLKDVEYKKKQEFMEKLNQLKEIDVEVSIQKIKIDELGISHISSVDLEALDFMLAE